MTIAAPAGTERCPQRLGGRCGSRRAGWWCQAVGVTRRRQWPASRSAQLRRARRDELAEGRRVIDPRWSRKPRTREAWREQVAQERETKALEVLNPALIWPSHYARALERLGKLTPPDQLSAAGRRRWLLAERLMVELTYPPQGHRMIGKDNDFLATFGVPTSVDDAPGAREALEAAPAVAAAGGSRTDHGDSWMVTVVHGPTWSVVFPFLPATGLVLLCVDALEEYCWRIDRDAESYALMQPVMDAVVMGWKNAAADDVA